MIEEKKESKEPPKSISPEERNEALQDLLHLVRKNKEIEEEIKKRQEEK